MKRFLFIVTLSLVFLSACTSPAPTTITQPPITITKTTTPTPVTITQTLTVTKEIQTITIDRSQRNYDLLQTNIIILALENKGYNVQVNDIHDMGQIYSSVAQGQTDFYPVAWLPFLQASYLEANQESLVSGGNLWGKPMSFGWTIPSYTAKEYGITLIEDLKGKGSIFGGKIYGYESGTFGTEQSLVALERYDLSDEYEFVTGSVQSMLSQLDDKIQQKQPVIVLLWRPNPIFSQLDLQILDDQYNLFGMNYCRYIANEDFANDNPEIIKFLNNLTIPLEEIETMMYENETKGISEIELANQWFNENKQTIDTWW